MKKMGPSQLTTRRHGKNTVRSVNILGRHAKTSIETTKRRKTRDTSSMRTATGRNTLGGGGAFVRKGRHGCGGEGGVLGVVGGGGGLGGKVGVDICVW